MMEGLDKAEFVSISSHNAVLRDFSESESESESENEDGLNRLVAVSGSHSGVCFSSLSLDDSSVSMSMPSETSSEPRRSTFSSVSMSMRSDNSMSENEPRRFSSVRHKYGHSVSSSRYDSESETDEEDYEKMNRRQVNGSNGFHGSSSSSKRVSIVRQVPLIENVVMGKIKTVVDEEHQRERGCLQTACLDLDDDFDAYDGNDRRHYRSLRTRIFIPILRLILAIMQFYNDLSPKKKKLYSYTFFSSLFIVSVYIFNSRSAIYSTDEEGFYRGNTNHKLPGVAEFIGEDQRQASKKNKQNKLQPPLNIKTMYNPPHPPNGLNLPATFEENLSDVGFPRKHSDVPLFWHVPRSAGSTMKEIMGSCMGLVLAADDGVISDRAGIGTAGGTSTTKGGGLPAAGGGIAAGGLTAAGGGGPAVGGGIAAGGGPSPSSPTQPPEQLQHEIQNQEVKQHLEIVQHTDGIRYINVDTTRMPGISRAKSLGLVESELAQVIVSVFAYDASKLFGRMHNGRLFTMFRHPVERNISLFHYLGWAVWEPTYDPKLAMMSVEEYARSPRREYNWMTRALTGNWEEDLTREHLDIAKTIIRRKCLVGLMEEKEESLKRFESFYHWSSRNRKDEKCRNRLLNDEWPNRYDHDNVDQESKVWKLLEQQNSFDVELYEYAKIIFKQQAILFM